MPPTVALLDWPSTSGRTNGDHATGTAGTAARRARMRALKAMPRAWNRFWRLVALYMPKRLYARSLIIVIAPMILLQSVVAFVFMERHWQTVTQRLSQAVDARHRRDHRHDRDLSARRRLRQHHPHRPGPHAAEDRHPAARPAAAARPKPFFSILDQILSTEITRQINRPFWIDTVGNSNIVEVRIQLEDKVLRVFVRRSQAYASNTHIFLIWMVGTSLVLLTIAIPFLRNQIRPILTLAEAAESFGKGRPMPRDFRPRGAEEVRRAGFAFIQMRERIERQIEQRTAMLTGVSHDLQHHPHPLQAAAGAGRRQARDQGSAQPGHRRHAVDAGRLSRLCPRRGDGGCRPVSISQAYFAEARRGGDAAQAQAVDRRSPAIRTCMCGPTPSPGCCPTSSAMPSAMPRRCEIERQPRPRLADRHHRRRRSGHSARKARGRVQAVRAARRGAQPRRQRHRPRPRPSPATSPAAMAATSRWTTARSAACGP